MRILSLLLSLLLAAGCQATPPLSGANDPHSPWWGIGLSSPAYMDGWVETVDVEDVDGKVFRRVAGGTVGGGYESGVNTEKARVWRGTGGTGKPVTGAGLPKRLFVRWQSVVERKTYRGWVEIPEQARQIMRDSVAWRCPEDPDQVSSYEAGLLVGVAPGGIIQIWVMDRCYRSVKAARAQAEIEPLGPHLGRSGGNYYPQSEASKRYIERWGIPYGSW